MIKKIMSVIAVVLATSMLLAACSTASNPSEENLTAKNTEEAAEAAKEEKIELNVMHYFTEEEAAADATRRIPREQFLTYDENNENVTLNITELQINDYETKIQALAAADNMPDVFMVKGSWVGNFVENELLADMTSFVESCEWKDSYRPNIFDSAIRDNTIYAAPTQYSATTLCFYNKALWKEAGYDTFPATWEELIASKDKFAEKNIYPVVLGNKNKWQYNSSWISAIGNRYTGSKWFDNIMKKDGSAHFTDKEFIDALAMTQNIGQNAGLNPDYSTIDHQQAASLYTQGKAATFIDGYWSLQYLIDNCTEEVLANTVITTHPTVEGAKGEANAVAAGCGWFLGVNSKLESSELQEAMDLTLYATGPETSKRFAEEYGMVSSCDVGDIDLSKFPQLQQDFIELIGTITPVAIYDANLDSSVIATMNDLFPELLAGNTTPEAAAEQIEKEYATSLS